MSPKQLKKYSNKEKYNSNKEKKMEEDSNENREISPIVDPPPNEKPKLGFIYRFHYNGLLAVELFFETSCILDD